MTDWIAICARSSEDALIKIFGGNFGYAAVEAAGAELAKRANPSPCPNLDQWRAEMKEKKRDAYVFDKLWKKACDELREMELGFSSDSRYSYSPHPRGAYEL